MRHIVAPWYLRSSRCCKKSAITIDDGIKTTIAKGGYFDVDGEASSSSFKTWLAENMALAENLAATAQIDQPLIPEFQPFIRVF